MDTEDYRGMKEEEEEEEREDREEEEEEDNDDRGRLGWDGVLLIPSLTVF